MALAVALTVAAVACGSDDKKSSSTTATATPSSAGSSTSSANGAAAPTPTTATKASIDPTIEAAPSRGFDGKTIKIAGIGIASNFTGADVGTKARVKRANDSDELSGIKIQYTDFTDDKLDPAVTLAEVRRLVTQEKVFALVPTLSGTMPGDYLAQQKVPYLGMAYDATYCTDTPSDKVWAFGFNGCLTPKDPKVMPDSYDSFYSYASQKLGKAKPTLAMIAQDSETGKNAALTQSSAARGAGFEVVWSKGVLPTTATDYTPYVQSLLTAAGGGQPDAINCLVAVQCISLNAGLKAAGFKGVFQSPLYDPRTAPALGGTISQAFFNTDSSPAMQQMLKDFDAVDPDAQLTLGSTAAYFAADMFIEALKKVGRNVTPDNVQQALAHQTWKIDGLAGPTTYPDSTVLPTPSCKNIVLSDGKQWTSAVPYKCSDKQIPVDPNFHP
jgi:ABC-type branched-subunit amino acid transport system substrate-binding protein